MDPTIPDSWSDHHGIQVQIYDVPCLVTITRDESDMRYTFYFFFAACHVFELFMEEKTTMFHQSPTED